MTRKRLAKQEPLPGVPPRPIRLGSTWLLPIPGYPGLFASSHGRIWSNRRGGWRKLKTYRNGYKRGDEARGGYESVATMVGRVRSNLRVHIAVALSWVGPKPGEQYQVDHIDDNHLNNRPENLQWLTAGQNQAKKTSGGMSKDEDWEDVL